MSDENTLPISIEINPSKAIEQVKEFTRTAESIFAASEARKVSQSGESLNKTKQAAASYQEYWKRALQDDFTFEKLLRQAQVEDSRRTYKQINDAHAEYIRSVQARDIESQKVRTAAYASMMSEAARMNKQFDADYAKSVMGRVEITRKGIEEEKAFRKAAAAEFISGKITAQEYNYQLDESIKRQNILTTGDPRARGDFHRFLAKTASLTFEATGAFYGLATAVGILGAPAILGVKFLKNIEDARLGITGILTSMTDAGDKNLQGPEKIAQAWKLAGQYVKQVQQDSLKYGIDMGKLAEVNRAVMAPGLSTGLNLTQIQKLSTEGAVGVSMLGLNSVQYVQEVRDLLAGGIQPASSTLATSLGITDKILKEWKAQGPAVFFKELDTRLKGFADTAERLRKDTLSGSWDMLTNKLSATLADPQIFAGLIHVINALSDTIGSPGFKSAVEWYMGALKFIATATMDFISLADKLKYVILGLVGAMVSWRVVTAAIAAFDLARILITQTRAAWGAVAAVEALAAAQVKLTRAEAIKNFVGKAGVIGMILFGAYEIADYLGWIDKIFSSAEERAKKFKANVAAMSNEALMAQLSKAQMNVYAAEDKLKKAQGGGFHMSSTYTLTQEVAAARDNLKFLQATAQERAKSQIDLQAALEGTKSTNIKQPVADKYQSVMQRLLLSLEAENAQLGKQQTNVEKVNAEWTKLQATKFKDLTAPQQALERQNKELALQAAKIADVRTEHQKLMDAYKKQTEEAQKVSQKPENQITGFLTTSNEARLKANALNQELYFRMQGRSVNPAFKDFTTPQIVQQAGAATDTSNATRNAAIALAQKELQTTVTPAITGVFTSLATNMGKDWRSMTDTMAKQYQDKVISMMVEDIAKKFAIWFVGEQTHQTAQATTDANMAASVSSSAVGNSSIYAAIAMLVVTTLTQQLAAGTNKRSLGTNTTVTGGLGGATGGGNNQLWQIDQTWFQGQKNWTETSRLSVQELNAYTASIKESRYAMIQAGDAMGYLNTASKTATIDITTSGDVTTALARSIGNSLLPALVLFQRQGETLTQTAQRLTDTFKATSNFITAIGIDAAKAFGGLGLASAAGRQALVDVSGGLQAFTQNANSFTQNFLTPAEKIAPMADQVARTFNQLGISGVTTNKQFADLVKQQTALGNTTVVAQLLSVSDAFNQITTAAAQANTQLNALLDKNTFATLVDYMRASITAGSAGTALAKAKANLPATLAAEQAGTAAFTAANQANITAANQVILPTSGAATTTGQGTIMDMIDAIVKALEKVFNWYYGPGGVLEKLFNGIYGQGGLWDIALSGLGTMLGDIWNGIKLWPENIKKDLADFWNSFRDWVSSFFNDIVRMLGDLPKTIWSAITSLPSMLADAVKGLFSGSGLLGSNGLIGGAIGGIVSGIGGLFSDPRLKENVTQVGTTAYGLGQYEFSYKSDPSHQMYRGVMSNEVRKVMPAAVTVGPDGYDRVNYGMLGIQMTKLNRSAATFAKLGAANSPVFSGMATLSNLTPNSINAGSSYQAPTIGFGSYSAPSSPNNVSNSELAAIMREVLKELASFHSDNSSENVANNISNAKSAAILDQFRKEGLPPERIAA